MMTREMLEELVALDALDLLDEQDRAKLRGELDGAEPALRSELRGVYDTAGLLGLLSPPVAPPPGVRERLMARMTPATEPAPTSAPGLRFIRDSDRWLPHPTIPGIRMRILHHDRAHDAVTLLMNVAPGTRYPSHHHSGSEQCYVIEGQIEVAGQRLGPGDFHVADAGTDHGELTSQLGATVLLIVSARDYL